MGAFGVELPENFDSVDEKVESGSDKEQSGTEIHTDKTISTGTPSPETTKAIEEILDLDKHERFRWGGKDWSLKELQDATMMRQDYSKKTAELSETRKYADNFDIDMQAVLNNPTLWDKFKEVYPQSWVSVAQRIIDRTYGQGAQSETKSVTNSNPQGLGQSDEVQKLVQHILNKEVGPLKEKIKEYDTEKYEASVQKQELWLENLYGKLSKKYPDALEEVVNGKAIALKSQGVNLNENVFERLFKESHEMMTKRWEDRTKKQVESQQKANQKALDMGTGGSVSAPSGTMTLKQAKQALMDAI